MPLHPQLQALRAQRVATAMTPLYEMSVEQARAADLAAIQAEAGTPEPVARVQDQTISGPTGDIPIRVYAVADPGPLPVLVYLFGGGWVLGTIDTSDAVCRRLANATRCVVVAVGYRLAPEHRFPAAVQDCYAATCWVAAHAEAVGGDAARLAVGGDSAGGNLAAVVAQLARDRGGPPLVQQVLVYPVTDYLPDNESVRQASDPYFFNARSMAWYWQHYLADPADGGSPLAAPLRAASLRGLPPALVITAEFDPLRDEGEQYAARLAAAGVPVEHTRYHGMVHGFVGMAGILDDARSALDQIAATLGRAFGR